MALVTFSPKSRQDLLDIGDYIAKDSRANARRFEVVMADGTRADYVRRDLLAVPIDLKIAGRDYQQECIQTVSKEIKQGLI